MRRRKPAGARSTLALGGARVFEDAYSWHASFLLSNPADATNPKGVRLAGGRLARPPAHGYSALEAPPHLQTRHGSRAPELVLPPKPAKPTPRQLHQPAQLPRRGDSAPIGGRTAFLTAGVDDWSVYDAHPLSIHIQTRPRSVAQPAAVEPPSPDDQSASPQSPPVPPVANAAIAVPPRRSLGSASSTWFAVPERNSYLVSPQRAARVPPPRRAKQRESASSREFRGERAVSVPTLLTLQPSPPPHASLAQRRGAAAALAPPPPLARLGQVSRSHSHHVTSRDAFALLGKNQSAASLETRVGVGGHPAAVLSVSGAVIRYKRPNWLRLELGRTRG